MPSRVDVAKRALVKVMRELAAKYGVDLALTRESSNNDVQKTFRKIAVKAHPDKGGSQNDFQKLSVASRAADRRATVPVSRTGSLAHLPEFLSRFGRVLAYLGAVRLLCQQQPG